MSDAQGSFDFMGPEPGGNVVAFRQDRPDWRGLPAGLAAKMLNAARNIATICEDGVAAYAVIAVEPDGAYRIGWEHDPDGPMGPTILTAYIQEIARREMMVEAQVAEFSIRHGWLKRDGE